MMLFKNMDTVVLLLSGGASSRYWPLPHKMLMSYLGISFIDHQIRLLQQMGLTNIIVVGRPEINHALGKTHVTKILQKGSGQAAAVLSAQKLISDKSVLILNATDVINVKLIKKVLGKAVKNRNLLVGRKVSQYFPGGYFELDRTRVVAIHEKPGEGNEPSQYTRLVCDYFANGFLLINAIKNVTTEKDDLYETAVTRLIKSGEIFEMIEYQDEWVPVKYPWDTLSLMQHYLLQIGRSRAAKTVKIHRTAQISGKVFLGQNVRVLEYAKLVGPLWVGDNTIIGNHTMVRASHIGANCVIGFNSDVTRSYLGDNVWLHSNYIGDSVVASGVSFGSGTVLANLRLDEQNVYSWVNDERVSTHLDKLGAMIGENTHIGVNVSVMPGIKIGKNSVVGAGAVVDRNLPDSTACFVKQTLDVKTNNRQVGPDRNKFKQKI